ncbi:hypothetical protein [Pseudobutyrivibrio xylanivorans]|uniref:Uncharacterized protein n=1 Tax=Pseudobutyrivibrio xylanivorans TaxID=185007 RepID=A0A5P6VLE0_PSEXY|nr:hypothetical protein [Pseudobutyrivibrio xylanivorans]QFJ53389.1 hypothetical protein FXF36_00125 [Pseudobutyrivibrio xylanivorans]QFJ53466.1 hypothetical protein FXF36_00535 [Pseudobutyrivibrio xylanivorans]
MMRYLSESEAAKSRSTTDIAKTLPASVQGYCYYAENTKGKSIGGIYIEVCQIRRFYDVIAESLAKSRDELVEDDLNSVSDEMIEEYLSIPFQPKFEGAKQRTVSEAERSRRINALYNYCEYLILEGILSRNLITKPESKRKKGRVIKNSSEVKFTGTAKVKTTVDGKYSLIKEKYGNKPNEYHYCIRDEKSGLFFLDDKGEKLVIKSYSDARNYVKKLY